MTGATLTCTKCFTPLSASAVNLSVAQPCAGCGNPLQAEVYPAFFRPIQRSHGGDLAIEEGQATCFYHPQKSAAVPCDACGRFLCSLCDVELHGEHLCPGCVESGRRKGKITTLENKRVLYDNIAMSLAIVPLIAWPLTLLTAPATIVFALMSWKKPGSLLPRSKIRFVIAISLAVATLVGWGIGGYMLAKSFHRK
jgi:hypothetical protein